MLAIALVIASGVALLVMSLTTLEALTETRDAYYERYRFADVFAHVEARARASASSASPASPACRRVETRIVRMRRARRRGFDEPVIGAARVASRSTASRC